MKKVSLGLLISGHEVAVVNGLIEEKEGVRDCEQMIKWEREGEQVFGNNISDAYEKLTKIVKEAYPNFNYRVTIDISKNG